MVKVFKKCLLSGARENNSSSEGKMDFSGIINSFSAQYR